MSPGTSSRKAMKYAVFAFAYEIVFSANLVGVGSPWTVPSCCRIAVEKYADALTSDYEYQGSNSMNKINILLAAALLMSVISANAVESSCKHCTAQLEQKTAKHEPFVIQRLYPAARVKSDCEIAEQIAAQRDEAAMDKMIEQDRIKFFAVGTKVYPVKSTDMGTWWLVREKGSIEKWWISVRAFSQD